VMDHHLGRPLTWLQLVGSYGNSLLVLGLAIMVYRCAWYWPEPGKRYADEG
jgi:hypothetical protein